MFFILSWSTLITLITLNTILANPTPHTSFSQIAKEHGYHINNMDKWLTDLTRYKHPDGRPKRRLNAFMCYKNAETDAIRQLYHEYALIAHSHHESLFPNYSYQPKSRSRTKAKHDEKPNKDSENDDDAPHEIIGWEEWSRMF